MLASLREAALAAGHPEWGHGGPHDSGHYNSHSSDTGFFKSYGGSWDTGGAGCCWVLCCSWAWGAAGLQNKCCRRQAVASPNPCGALPTRLLPCLPPLPRLPPDYGRFFLAWYSGLLIQHADRVLGAARAVLSARCRPRTMREARELSDGGMLYVFEPAVQLGIKLAGVHWCAAGGRWGLHGGGAWGARLARWRRQAGAPGSSPARLHHALHVVFLPPPHTGGSSRGRTPRS